MTACITVAAMLLLLAPLSSGRMVPLDSRSASNALFLHVHIPKTGGTTLVGDFPAIFSSVVTACEQNNTVAKNGRDFQSDVLDVADFSKCNFVSYEEGLWMRNVLPKDRDVKTLMLFRNPLELRLSGLEHGKRRHGKDPSAIIAIAVAGGDYDGYQMQDQQTRMLACPHTYRAHGWCEPNLQDAAALLNSVWWIGLAEFYHESICVLAYKMGAFRADECRCAGQQEVSGLQVLNAMQPELFAESSYTVKELKDLAAMNRHDLMTYSLAATRFFADAQEVYAATGVPIFC